MAADAERPVTLGPSEPQEALCDATVCRRRERGGLAGGGGGKEAESRKPVQSGTSQGGRPEGNSAASGSPSMLPNFPSTSGEGEQPGPEFTDTLSCLLVLPPGEMRG